MICCRLVHVSSINKISKIIQVMSSFMVGSVRIYGWSELTILSHRCCLWHWVYRMSAFTTHWFLKLLGYIYIHIYIYAIIIVPMIFPRIIIHIYIYWHTHTPKKQKKTCWTNLHNCCMVVSNHGGEAGACAACTGCKGASKATATSPLSVTTSAGPWGFPQHQQMCKRLRWVCWMIFMGSMAFIPPQNGSGYIYIQ